MHIYFSGIGGAGIGPLALIAQQAGFTVSGSDKKDSQYTRYLEKHGVNLHIGQTMDAIERVHATNPIDWIVISSAVPLENPNHPELVFAQAEGIKITKRNDCINEILRAKELEMIAIAGTHGKTTATAMVVWALQKLGVPISYSVGAKIGFGNMGHYEPGSKYFVYECDEFDRNFLGFHPAMSLLTVVDWDHHDIYPTRDDYKDAFRQFIEQSNHTVMFERESNYLGLAAGVKTTFVNDTDPLMQAIKLPGLHNRQNAFIVANAVQKITGKPLEEIIAILSEYPGSERRFEKLADNIYTDYAHTPEEITATLQLAREVSDNVVVVYEPLTNRRQHYMKDLYDGIFEPAKKIYWLPSYLAREDPTQHILTPTELIQSLSEKSKAESAELNDELFGKILRHAQDGDLVLCLAGGGGYSLDEFLRSKLKVQ